MSRIDELKKQNLFLTIDGIEIINHLVGKSKYTEMLVNLIKNDRLNQHDNRRADYEYEMIELYGVKKEVVAELSTVDLLTLSMFMNNFVGTDNFRMFKEFIDLNEQNLIVQNDVTKYKTFKDIELQISLSELKNINKELSKQTHKLYEDEEWLVIKPMSYQASLKYGASTKWCTASRDNSDYYLRYSRNGILIYCINKITGDKVGAFKRIDEYERETSFWDIVDQRIDSMESGLPIVVMDVIKKEFKEQVKSNFELLSDEERNRQLMELEVQYIKSQEDLPLPQNEAEATYVNRLRNTARIVRMRRPIIDAEQELSNLINEDIERGIVNELHRLVDIESQDEEVVGYEYPDQAG
jgi:hypothetical protein